jgi:hypothetical protein
MRPTGTAEAVFVGSMLAGASLAEGVHAALQLEPDFDLPTLLQRQIADQVWSAFY